jgi:hypothetical protein
MNIRAEWSPQIARISTDFGAAAAIARGHSERSAGGNRGWRREVEEPRGVTSDVDHAHRSTTLARHLPTPRRLAASFDRMGGSMEL